MGRVEFRVRGEIFDMYYLSIEGVVKELGGRGKDLPLHVKKRSLKKNVLYLGRDIGCERKAEEV